MGGSRKSRGPSRLLWVMAGCSILVGGPAWPGSPDGPPVTEPRAPRVRLRDGFAAAAVRKAVTGARRRLGEPKCQELLSEFSDASGRPLRAALEDLGRTPQEHLDEVFFYDGSSQPRCGKSGILAVTAPEGRLVFVCVAQFVRAYHKSRLETEYIVIHEMLHTLGLGENPPSSRQINARVATQCGR